MFTTLQNPVLRLDVHLLLHHSSQSMLCFCISSCFLFIEPVTFEFHNIFFECSHFLEYNVACPHKCGTVGVILWLSCQLQQLVELVSLESSMERSCIDGPLQIGIKSELEGIVI